METIRNMIPFLRKPIFPSKFVKKITIKDTTLTIEPNISPTNKIRTAKYTIYNFLVKNLFEQFRRIANFYFIIMLVLQFIPEISAWPPTLAGIPIFIVLGIAGIKDAIEDSKRHIADHRLNSAPAHLYRESKFQTMHWEDVLVGDIIRINKDENIPADILILSTNASDGECFVETKNLDGETNLKNKRGIQSFKAISVDGDLNNKFNFELELPPPSNALYEFNGTLIVKNENKSENETDLIIALSQENILLRGCTLRTTEWVLGLVVYTGVETKIVLNSGKTPSKRTKIERQMNPQIATIFGIQLLMSFICAVIGGVVQWRQQQYNPPFLPSTFKDYYHTPSYFYEPAFFAFMNFWTFILISQNLIPIALYATFEIIKGVQAYFINADIEMYHEPTNTRCVPRSWNLSDDLGQIEYLFSDKTGTLTENIMTFKQCTINSKQYGFFNRSPTEMIETRSWENISKILEEKYGQNRAVEEDFGFNDPSLANDLVGEDKAQKKLIKRFFTILAVCHTVVIDKEHSGTGIKYNSQSPDETALVDAARNFGFVFTDRNDVEIECLIQNKEIKYQLLHEIPFSSERKRMSVVVKLPTGEIFLFCKGADNVILERAKEGKRKSKHQNVQNMTKEHLYNFALVGLRTLCIAQRELDEKFFVQWKERYQRALINTEDRDGEIAKCEAELECELEILGGTAIEDKLQDNVPETIEKLRRGGIKVWMLTGDKLETAINIGVSCRLIPSDSQQKVVFSEHIDPVTVQIQQKLQEIEEVKDSTFSLIIDGKALSEVLGKSDIDLNENAKLFLKLTGHPNCKSVICCRVSPLQKARVVKLVKKNLDVMTLAVGDGANDVSMIQTADIGVGISGLEGRQAVMSSDFSIGRFYFLSKLILVHGRWCYFRTAEMTLIFFIKNFIFVMPLFFFQSLENYTAQSIYHFSYQMMFNLVFTSIPVMALGGFDQEVGAEYTLQYPEIFRVGINQERFNRKMFWLFVIEGIWQAVACFLIPYMVYGKSEMETNIFEIGTYVFTSVALCANLTVAMMVKKWNWILYVGIFVPMIFFFLFHVFIDAITQPTSSAFTYQLYYLGFTAFSQGVYWLLIPVTVVLAFIPRFTLNAYFAMFRPEPIDIVRELEILSQPSFEPSHILIAPHNHDSNSNSNSNSQTPKPLNKMDVENHEMKSV